MRFEMQTFAPNFTICELVERGAKIIKKEPTYLGSHTQILFRIVYEAEEEIYLD